MNRLNHHEQALNLAGIVITTTPWLIIGAQVAVNAIKKKRGRK